jgi:hypothetical protein
MPAKSKTTRPKGPLHRHDGNFPSHGVSAVTAGQPYPKYFTTLGHFESDAEAIAGALEDFPFKEVRVVRFSGQVIYDSKQGGLPS